MPQKPKYSVFLSLIFCGVFFLKNCQVKFKNTLEYAVKAPKFCIIVSFAVKISTFCKIFSLKSKCFKILGEKIIFVSVIPGKFFIVSKVRQKVATSHCKYVALGWVVACNEVVFVNVRMSKFINFTSFEITMYHKFQNIFIKTWSKSVNLSLLHLKCLNFELLPDSILYFR